MFRTINVFNKKRKPTISKNSRLSFFGNFNAYNSKAALTISHLISFLYKSSYL